MCWNTEKMQLEAMGKERGMRGWKLEPGAWDLGPKAWNHLEFRFLRRGKEAFRIYDDHDGVP